MAQVRPLRSRLPERRAVVDRVREEPIHRASRSAPNQKNAIFNRNAIGWNIRANFGFDLASNTAYGPLIGHFDINSDLGNGFDSPGGSATYVNTGYITWAGLTAGKAQSFYSFIGGGDNWNNFFSPDRKGFNEPNLCWPTPPRSAAASRRPRGGKPGHGGLLRRRHQHDRRLRAEQVASQPLPVPQRLAASVGPTSSALYTTSRDGAKPRSLA